MGDNEVIVSNVCVPVCTNAQDDPSESGGEKRNTQEKKMINGDGGDVGGGDCQAP